MKDEPEGKIISEFVGLKSKMYSLVAVDNEEIKKAKKVNKNVVKKVGHKEYVDVKNRKHKEFVDVLFNKKMMRHKVKRIQSKLHRLGNHDICKSSLPFFDDKRHILGDGVRSLAYFHKDVKANRTDKFDKINKVK